MNLVLRSVSMSGTRLKEPLIGRFSERGGTIGRSDTATYELPDPERRISRVQAEVFFDGRDFWLENQSEANPIQHNGRPLSWGMRVALREKDQLRIGTYEVIVDESGKGTQEPRRLAPAPAADDADAQALWRALSDGVGFDLTEKGTPTADLMRTVGAMLRTSVEGICQLVAMRAQAKQDMEAEATMIQSRGNNPIKFAPNAQVALKLVLQPPMRGFLPGAEALRNAMSDIQSHQVGVMAGMRSAIGSVLDSFDPVQLEGRLVSRSVLDSVLPAQRRARLWDVFLEHYRALRTEALEDFERLYGEAFLRAYEDEIARRAGKG